MRVQQGILPIAVERTCPNCKGRGTIVTIPCPGCKASGLRKSEHTLEVTVPPGVEHGTTRIVSGAGNRPRPDKPAGDLIIEIHVAPHPFFRRSADDVLCTVPITFTQAALGSEVEVPTLDGKGKLRVPQGSQPGATLRIRGKGMPKRAGVGRGDQLVTVNIEVPTNLTPRQRELIEELARELGVEATPERRGFLDKLRELFG